MAHRQTILGKSFHLKSTLFVLSVNPFFRLTIPTGGVEVDLVMIVNWDLCRTLIPLAASSLIASFAPSHADDHSCSFKGSNWIWLFSKYCPAAILIENIKLKLLDITLLCPFPTVWQSYSASRTPLSARECDCLSPSNDAAVSSALCKV